MGRGDEDESIVWGTRLAADYPRGVSPWHAFGYVSDYSRRNSGKVAMMRSSAKVRGFTILELMVAMAIFLVICGAMFALLQLSQQRYSSETQMSGSFQEARLGIDQIVRDINMSGYPSAGMLSNTSFPATYAVSPFAWDPGYTNTPPTTCQVGLTCNPTPGDFDLIVETNISSGVSWIRYQLNGTTLYRTVVPKTAGADPVTATSGTAMTPFVENVMNNVPDPLLGQITAQYPSMFPTGPVPVFQYTCATPSGPQSCTLATGYNAPQNISDVDIVLIVKTPQTDAQTHSLQLIELTGRGHRSNPTN
jgi:prepilin-type N-terminal cleavage/methylation domain-containing protein